MEEQHDGIMLPEKAFEPDSGKIGRGIVGMAGRQERNLPARPERGLYPILLILHCRWLGVNDGKCKMPNRVNPFPAKSIYIVFMRFFTLIAALLLGTFVHLAPSSAAEAKKDTSAQTMSLDVKDVDIRDAVRMISKANSLSIVCDSGVTGKVTVHLTNVPIMVGLQTIAETNGLEVIKEGTVYLIRRRTDETHSTIKYAGGLLTVDVQNVDIQPFLQELSTKTAVSIVPDSKVVGKISGKLFQVGLDDGLRALLEGNGFTVTKRRNIFQVSAADRGTDQTLSPMRQYRPVGANKPNFYLNYANGKLSVEVTNGDLEDIIKAIAAQTDLQLITYGSIKSEVNAKIRDVPIEQAIALLLGGTRFTFVIKDSVILIGDRNAATPSGQAFTKSELLPLKHVKADEVAKNLPKTILATSINVIKEQNALLVSGTSEDVAVVREFTKTVDIPTPQVRIDAVIVEYSEDLSKEFGINYWNSLPEMNRQSYKLVPSPDTRAGAGSTALEIGAAGKDIKNILGFIPVVGKIPDDFFAVLRILESQNKAKILAQPSILTLNGNKASINVNETEYFKVVTGVQEYQTTRFQPITFGITLNITPWISQSGQITAEIAPEVSNSQGTNTSQGDNYPNVYTRSLSTTVRLNNGQTLVLGGLIKNNETTFEQKIPFLGDIPILGNLFKYSGKTRSKTNLVIYITPHIVSNPDSAALEQQLRDFDKPAR
jgi:type IV pilus assembly protein PilQ